MSQGSAARVRLNGSPATNLANEILDLGSHEALVLGDLADGLPDRIKIKKDEFANAERGTFGRTRRTFVYRSGEAAVALLDYDQKGMPADVYERLAQAGGFDGAIATLLPEYSRLARVVRASTSAGILNSADWRAFPGLRRA